MGWNKLGKVTLSINDTATPDNRQPHFKGSIEMSKAMKKDEDLNISLWLNYDKKDPTKIISGSVHLSNFTKDEELFPDDD
tara:strand:- start:983 stop:1222 length:240 start_codon:yes stop_codon:yes gene_type:complete